MDIDTVKEGDTLIAKTEGRVDGTNARSFRKLWKALSRAPTTPSSWIWSSLPISAAPDFG